MAIDFPNSPTSNQIFTSGERSWKYDGEKWVSYTEGGTAPSAGSSRDTMVIVYMEVY